jgi:hypothetical protein
MALVSHRAEWHIVVIETHNGVTNMTNTNMPKLSNRAQKALDVLANGGRFVNRLERNSYTGREQFQKRLLADGRWGSVVSGIGHAAFHELDRAGFLAYAPGEWTSVTEVYKLRTAA